MTIDSAGTYPTSSLQLAAAIALYLPIEGVDTSDASRCVFHFSRSLELDRLLEQYHRRELYVETQAYAESTKRLKSRIYGRE